MAGFEESTQPVVVDNGSLTLKAGFGGMEEPTVCLQTEGAIDKRIIQNWEGVETLWRQAFRELGAELEESPFFVTEPPLNPKPTREKMAVVAFESMECPSFYGGKQHVLAS